MCARCSLIPMGKYGCLFWFLLNILSIILVFCFNRLGYRDGIWLSIYVRKRWRTKNICELQCSIFLVFCILFERVLMNKCNQFEKVTNRTAIEFSGLPKCSAELENLYSLRIHVRISILSLLIVWWITRVAKSHSSQLLFAFSYTKIYRFSLLSIFLSRTHRPIDLHSCCTKTSETSRKQHITLLNIKIYVSRTANPLMPLRLGGKWVVMTMLCVCVLAVLSHILLTAGGRICT